jgi:hypothetical protein
MSRKPKRKKPIRKRRRKPESEADERAEQKELERRNARYSQAHVFLYPFGSVVYDSDGR